MKKILTILLLICATLTQAQNYKWVKGGGGTSTPGPGYDNDEIKHVCTDDNGNVYVLASTIGPDVFADTFYRQAHISSNTNHVFFASYNCEGQMRWAKFFDCNGFSIPYGLVYDSGSVYVATTMIGGNKYIDYDTLVTSSLLHAALISYDTSGEYNWIRFATEESSSTLSGNKYGTLAIDGQHNIHHFKYIRSGAPVTNSITSEHGVYDLVYNSLGDQLSVTRLNMDSVWYLISTDIDPLTGKLYAIGLRDQDIIADPAVFVAAYDAARNVIWSDTTGNNNSKFNSIVCDDQGSLYITVGHSINNFVFQNINMINSQSQYDGMGMIMKMDTIGSVTWVYAIEGSTVIVGLGGLAILPNGNIAAVGVLGGVARHGLDSIVTPTSEGQNPYFTIIDTAGNLIKLDQLHGVGFYDRANAVAADKNGNLYIGGKLENNIWADTLTPYVSNGGNSDFFVMKYGYNCNCVAPDAGYTFDVNTLTGNFTFNGSALIDSLVWDFGDGNSATTTGTTTSHTYLNDDSTYTVCVTVYNECGNTTFCDTVSISAVSVSNIGAFPNVQVYPNPSEEYMIVEGAEGMNAALFSVTGQRVYSGVAEGNKHSINTSNLSAGTYLLQLTASDGRKMSMTVVKR